MSETTATTRANGVSAKGGVPYPRRWLAAVVMVGAVLMDMIDITIVNVALPTIGRDLDASGTELEWVVSAYMLAFAAVLITAGSFGDLLGRKRIFCGGIAAFGLASLAAGAAQDPGPLIAARVVQGAAAAAMVPQLLGTYRVIFDRAERGKAFGMYGAIIGFFSALGLIAGGALTDADILGLGWRAIFVINVPIAAGAFVASARVVPETREPQAGRPDLAGAALLTGAIVAVAYPLLEGRSEGWPAWIWLLSAAGVAALIALFAIEDRRQHARIAPLLRTRLFRIPAFTAGLVVQFAAFAGVQGFFLIFALWSQLGMGFSALAAGLTTVAFSVGSFVLAPRAVALAERYGRTVLSLGGVLMAAGVAGLWIGADGVGQGSNPWPVVPGLIVAGAGLSLLLIPLANVVLAAVPGHAAGAAGGEGHSFIDAFRHALPIAGALFLPPPCWRWCCRAPR
jgi:EmrB/QacA subfamily drug resistance transporter